MLSVSLRQLEYACAADEYASVSAAAQALNVSQPALSVAIAGLEAHLGRPLFIRRKGSPLTPTSFGRGFLAEARHLLGSADRLINLGDTSAQPIVLGCFEDLAPLVLAPILSGIRDHDRDAKVISRTGSFETLAEALAFGQMDMAVTYDLGLDPGYDRRVIAALPPVALLGASHPLAGRPALSLHDLAGEALVLADQGLSIRHMIGLFQDRGVTPGPVTRAATLETMRSLVANGFGVGLTYTQPAGSLSYDGKPVGVVPLSDDLPAARIVLATYGINALAPLAERIAALIAAMPFPGAATTDRR